MNSAREIAPHIGIAATCLGLGVWPVRRSTARSVRYRRASPAPRARPRPAH